MSYQYQNEIEQLQALQQAIGSVSQLEKEIEEAKEKITKLEGTIQTEGVRKQPPKDAFFKEAEEEEYQRRLRRERRVKNKRAIGIFIPTIIIGLLLVAAQIYYCIQFGQILVFEFAALSILIYGLLLIAVKTMATKRGLGIAMGIITRILSIMGIVANAAVFLFALIDMDVFEEFNEKDLVPIALVGLIFSVFALVILSIRKKAYDKPVHFTEDTRKLGEAMRKDEKALKEYKEHVESQRDANQQKYGPQIDSLRQKIFSLQSQLNQHKSFIANCNIVSKEYKNSWDVSMIITYVQCGRSIPDAEYKIFTNRLEAQAKAQEAKMQRWQESIRQSEEADRVRYLNEKISDLKDEIKDLKDTLGG